MLLSRTRAVERRRSRSAPGGYDEEMNKAFLLLVPLVACGFIKKKPIVEARDSGASRVQVETRNIKNSDETP